MMSRVSGHRVAVVFLSSPELDGQPIRVKLVVAAGHQETLHTLAVGGQFPAGDEVWKVAEVEYLGDYDYVVRLERV